MDKKSVLLIILIILIVVMIILLVINIVILTNKSKKSTYLMPRKVKKIFHPLSITQYHATYDELMKYLGND